MSEIHRGSVNMNKPLYALLLTNSNLFDSKLKALHELYLVSRNAFSHQLKTLRRQKLKDEGFCLCQMLFEASCTELSLLAELYNYQHTSGKSMDLAT